MAGNLSSHGCLARSNFDDAVYTLSMTTITPVHPLSRLDEESKKADNKTA